jgi:transposase
VPKTIATHIPENSPRNANLLLAFELGKKTWKLGFAIGFSHKPHVLEMDGGDTAALLRAIEEARERFGLSADAPVTSCYEAGRDGFWLHRFLTAQGIRNLVVDSSSIEVNRKARRAKTDSVDVQQLLKLLIRHLGGEPKVWSIARVPSVSDEDARSLHRELRTLVKERSRSTNRIKGLLMNHGIRLESIRKDFLDWLERVRLWDGSCLPLGVRRRIEREYERRQMTHRQVLELEAQRRETIRKGEGRALEKVQQLLQLRGIGEGSAWLYVMEFFSWRDFQNAKEVGALAGLAPTPHQSGEEEKERGISKSGNRHVRGLAIEIAWGWLHYQPDSALTQWYRERFAKAGPRARKVGIVALARKLLIALWRYLETGALPEGARLKA